MRQNCIIILRCSKMLTRLLSILIKLRQGYVRLSLLDRHLNVPIFKLCGRRHLRAKNNFFSCYVTISSIWWTISILKIFSIDKVGLQKLFLILLHLDKILVNYFISIEFSLFLQFCCFHTVELQVDSNLIGKRLLENPDSVSFSFILYNLHDLLLVFFVIWPALKLHILVQSRQLMSLMADRFTLRELLKAKSNKS